MSDVNKEPVTVWITRDNMPSNATDENHGIHWAKPVKQDNRVYRGESYYKSAHNAQRKCRLGLLNRGECREARLSNPDTHTVVENGELERLRRLADPLGQRILYCRVGEDRIGTPSNPHRGFYIVCDTNWYLSKKRIWTNGIQDDGWFKEEQDAYSFIEYIKEVGLLDESEDSNE